MLEDDAGFADSNETHAKLRFSVSGFVQFETVIFLKELISFPCKVCHRVGIIDKVAVSLAKVALVGFCPSSLPPNPTSFVVRALSRDAESRFWLLGSHSNRCMFS